MAENRQSAGKVSDKSLANLKGGSRKGKPNKVTAAVKDMILGALSDAGGQAYLARQAEANPAAFMTLVGKVLPLDVNANVNQRRTVVLNFGVQPE